MRSPPTGELGAWIVSSRNRWGTSTFHKGRVLKGWEREKGYLLIQLSNPRKNIEVHRLVCRAFHGEAPAGKPFALHWDGNPRNNTAENIYWGSPKQNSDDKKRHGTGYFENLTHCKRGHSFSEENTLTYRGQRFCRPCRRLRESQRRKND